MTKDVFLTITSAHSHPDSETDHIDLITHGTLRDLEGALEVSYQETELTDMDGTTTSIILQGNQVTLMRNGPVCSQMVFEQGRRHLSVYATPYGNLEIAVFTRRLGNHLTAEGGTLEIDYALEADHALVGVIAYRLTMQVQT